MVKVTNWKNIIIGVLSICFLIVFYFQFHLVNNIQSRQNQLNQVINSNAPASAFEREFDESGVVFDRSIHNKLTELREKTGAGWAVLWGFHDGKKVGPLHLKRISIIDEKSKHVNNRFFPIFQNWNMNIFADYYIQYWKTQEPLNSHIEDIDNDNIKLHFSSRGVHYKNAIGIYIDKYDHPIALLSLYYTEEESEKFQNDPEQIIKTNDLLKEYEASISESFTERYEILQNQE